MPEPSRRSPLWSAAVSVLLSAGFLLAPAMGTDLAAQQARADFFAAHGTAPIDFGWYGGVVQFGYSLFTAPLGSLIGMRLLGALAAVVSAVAFHALLSRGGARRPVLGGVLGAFVFAANLVSGRVTFAVGLALALVALYAAALARPSAPSAPAAPAGRMRPGWIVVAGVLGALATWASPVAGLFAGVAGGALLLTGPVVAWFATGRVRLDRGMLRPDALALCLGPLLALAPMAVLFSNGGEQPFTAESMRIHVALAVLVALVVPARFPAVRIGGALTVVLLIGAYALASPIGSNALRLPMLFTIPLIAALADFGPARRRADAGARADAAALAAAGARADAAALAGAGARADAAALAEGRVGAGGGRAPGRGGVVALVLLLVAVFWWQPFVVTGDLGRAGSAESGPEFYRALGEELARRAPGRVEVVPLRDHWESAYVAPDVPLARGWERQVDTARNALFYADELPAADYVAWLRANAVSYVAIAPESVPDRYARTESALVRGGLPELREVWRDDTWQLFEVAGAQPLVAAPGTLVASDRGGVTLRVGPAAGSGAAPATGGSDVLVRVRWSRWLSLGGAVPGGACLAPGPDDWTILRAPAPGEYRVTSSLRPGPAC